MNPLLNREFKIPFSQISSEHIESGVREALKVANTELEALIQNQNLDFESILGALDALIEKLNHPIRLASHLMSVKDNPELRKGFEAVQPEFSAFFAKLPLNEKLWQQIKNYSTTEEARGLTTLKKRHLDKTMREFIRAGADLPKSKKKRAEEVKVELSQLQTKFANNVLDATNAFEFIASEDDLAGLPASVIRQAKENAQSKGIKGHRFTLQVPSFLPFMKYSDRRDLRKHFYHAYSNRAYEGEFDNCSLIEKILSLRKELALLHDYNDFADYRLEMNMVKSGQAASDFLEDLTTRTEPYFKKEVDLLNEFAQSELGITNMQPWDILYIMEKLRKAKFDIDDEVLRPYFPLDSVLTGLFELAHKVFGIKIIKQENTELWYADIDYYDIYEEGTYLGSFYADWFPREAKRSGAWMNYFYTGGPQSDGNFKPHLGLVCANFTPPQEGKPPLLTHEEVETVFHEFGHLLHHMLSKVTIPSRAGTNVSWDFVELPSQIMENWCWEREALDIFAKHYETQETIPKKLFDKMMSARVFMSAYQQMRQLSFGTLDLALHINYCPDKNVDAVSYARKVIEPFQIKPEFANNNFVTTFSHIFTGAYAAGYYSYKWAEVLEADAFTRFKREGILNRETGRAFAETVLSRGDSTEPEELFREFMGRDPDISALLKRTFAAN